MPPPTGSSSTEIPVAELVFTAEDTGWFLSLIDGEAYGRDPDDELAWRGDLWPLEVAGVDVDALVALSAAEGLDAMRRQAQQVATASRSSAVVRARAWLISDLATDRAKGVRSPHDASRVS